MGDVQDTQLQTEEQGVSRRNFIKGVVASGAAVSASNYVLRNGVVLRWLRLLGQSNGS